MTIFIALLRGVNVGGKTKVDMKELKAQFEALGCTDVRTYINSGNVVFRDRRKASTLKRALEEELGRPVAVRDLAQVEKLCASIRKDWTNDKEQKTDVAFALDGGKDRVFHALRTEVEPGHTWGLDDTVTVRNVNTVRKLLELMRAV